MESEEKLFCNYIQELREKRNITLVTLCDGLCDYQEMIYMEKGTRLPDIRLQDALLERLGVGAENEEHYVDFQEYEHWEDQQKILYSICYEQWDCAMQLLEVYQNKYGMQNKLEYQFILSMHGQIRKGQGAEKEELYEIYEKAAKLTIQREEHKSIFDMALSLKELNLLLELEQCRESGERWECYLDIMKYIEMYFDRVGVAKLYAKAVYLLCRCNVMFTNKGLLEYCDRALEYLRDTSRLHYMWEILQLREDMLAKEIDTQGNNVREIEKERLAENHSWLEALNEVYDDYHVRRETFEYTYLYVKMGVFCTNDVIRIRREMLGMSQKELCEGFCELKTLRAIENRKRKPQKATRQELFRRLGLPNEHRKTNLLTSKQEIKQLMEAVLKDINALNWDEAENKIAEIHKKVSLENRYNLQVLLKEETYLHWKKSEISTEEYCKRMRRALELTVSLDSFLKEGEKYLTHMELVCIQNLMQGVCKEDDIYQVVLKRLEEYYEDYEDKGLLQVSFNMYGFVMTLVASELGNKGKFVKSNKYLRIMIEGCLRFRKLGILPLVLNDSLWNNIEQRKQNIPVEKEIDEIEILNRLVALSHLGKQGVRVKFFQQKLKRARESTNIIYS